MLGAAHLSPVFGGVMDVVNEVTDRLDELSSHWWFIGVILVIAYLDSIVPVVPSETAVILGGVAAGQGNQEEVRTNRRAERQAQREAERAAAAEAAPAADQGAWEPAPEAAPAPVEEAAPAP